MALGAFVFDVKRVIIKKHPDRRALSVAKKAARGLDTIFEIQGEQEKIDSILRSLASKLSAEPLTAAEIRKLFLKYEKAQRISLNLSNMVSTMRKE